MRIPRFWTREIVSDRDPRTGMEESFVALGWSFDSEAAARADAEQRARRLAERVRAGDFPDSYGYFDRPIREEIVETIVSGDEQHALITRNRYGALVLNSEAVLFADVDFPTARPRGFWDALRFAFSPDSRRARQHGEDQAVWSRIRRWAEANPSRSFRLYRTLRGMRLLMTDRHYAPAAGDTTALLEALGADPLYLKLTRTQECFRARLSPKPWRCGFRPPPHQFPFPNPAAEQQYRRWEREFADHARGYRACELVGQFGQGAADATIDQTVAVHDRHACAPGAAPLA